jgi:hypothetical protein
MNECDMYLNKTIEIARKMIDLADRAEEKCTDNGCAAVYGILRDSAYRIRKEAEHEQKKHSGIFKEQ